MEKRERKVLRPTVECQATQKGNAPAFSNFGKGQTTDFGALRSDYWTQLSPKHRLRHSGFPGQPRTGRLPHTLLTTASPRFRQFTKTPICVPDAFHMESISRKAFRVRDLSRKSSRLRQSRPYHIPAASRGSMVSIPSALPTAA